ncbi:MAG: toxin HicA [Syntrophales bacterium]
MAGIEDILLQMKNNPANVRFADLSKVCNYYFGKARHKDGIHHVYKTLWKGDPRINIQNHKGKAKAYQVKQVLLAIEKLEVEHATEE